LAGTISTAKLKVSSSGAKGVAGQLDQVGKATDRVGRAQTRLGQASAASGRQFAAQASGLGGLVAAYAGAAATVFALQAAFDALNKAARAETIIAGTKALALEIGQSGPKILKEVKSITQGQIELSEAAQNINIALSAGFNTEQISRLTKVSLGASRALGRNLTDALQRVVRGAAKLEPELLDELGIFTRIDPAVNKYAQRLGVAATTLTDFERRQAFVNAVITEGERKFSAIDTTSKSTQKSLEQLVTQIQELALEFGGLIANALQPLVGFFKNNVGNTLLLFGGILALVFGKATEIVGNFAKNSVNNLSDFAAKYADSAAKAKGATDTIIKGQKELAVEVAKNKRGLGGAASFTQGLTRDLSSEAAGARRRFLSGEDLDPRQRAKDTQVLTQAREKLAAAGRKNSAAYSDATKILKTYAAAEETAGGKARFLTAASVKLQGAIKGVAAAAALAGKALNLAFIAVGIAQLAGSFLDVDLIGMLSDAFKDLSQRAEDLTNGLVGLTVAAAGGGTALADSIKRITDREEVLESIPKKIREISEEIENAAKKDVDVLYSRTTIELQRQEEATKLLKEAQDDLASARRKNNAEDIEAAKVDIKLIEAVIDRIKLFDAALIGLAGEVQRSTGLAGANVAESFKEGAIGVQLLNGQLTIAGIQIDKINGKFTTTDLPKAQQEAVDAQIIFNSVLKETNEGLAAGALNSDKLSAKIKGLSDQIIEIEEKGGLGLISTFGGTLQATELRDIVQGLREIQTELKALETVGKGIAKAFSGAFTALDTAPFKGLVDLTGNLAANSQRAKENQSNFLRSVIQTNKARLADPATNPAFRPALEESLNLAIKASAGSILEYFQTAKKVTETEKVKAQQLDKQLQTLKDQQAVQKLQRDNAFAIETEKQLRDASQARFNQAEKALELRQLTFDLAQKELDAAEKLAIAQAKNDATRLKVAQIGRQTGANANEAARDLNQGILENQLAILNEKSFKDQTAINAKKRELIELERQFANERFAEQKSLIEFERDDSLQQLETQKGIEKERLNRLNDEKSALDQFNKDQLTLFDRQSALETQKLTDQKTQLERERQIVLARADAQLTASEADEKIFNQQSQNTLLQLKGFKDFRETINVLVEATGSNSPFVQAIAELIDVSQPGRGTDFRANLATIPQQTTAALDEAIALSEGNITKQGEIFKLQRKGITDQSQGESNLNNLRQSGITGQIENQEKLRIIERDILSTTLAGKAQELAAEIKLQETKLEGLPLQELELRAQATQKIEELDQQRIKTLETLNQRVDTLARSEDRLGQALDQSQSIVKESFTGAFMKLNDALIDGSITMGMVANTFKDMVGNMLREIQQAVFRKTIVDPLTDVITGSIGGMFGGGINPGAVVAGNVGAPVMSAAQGGRVHMAGGGMKRDRVPAMLEPGEFVMRKEAVKQAGVGTMMRMNAAPQQLQSGGKVMQGNATYSVARAMELEAKGLSPTQARSVAQEEANRSKSVGGAFSFSDNVINSMRMQGAPSISTPATPSNALDAVQNMLKQNTSFFGFGEKSKSKPQKPTNPFKGIKPRTKPQGFGSFFKGVYNSVADAVGLDAIATAGQSVKGFYDSSSVYSDSGEKVGSASAPVSKGVDPMTPGMADLANSLMKNNKLSVDDAYDVAMGIVESKESFDPKGNLADVLGADGRRGIPISIIGALLGLDVPALFSKDPSMPTNQQGKARLEVNRRTGQMATGFKGSFKSGDVTNSGNFMRADETGVVSGIDPFALDKLGYSGNIAATMGGSRGFRAAGSGVEFSSLNDFITANFVAPGRQSALTVAEYNAMSQEGRGDYAPGLGGGRALSTTQANQFARSGAYYTPGRGLTIPSGSTYSGSLNRQKSFASYDTGFSSYSDSFNFDDDFSIGGGGGKTGGGYSGGFGGTAGTTNDFSDGGDYDLSFASGGIVRKMAAGGAVQSRDRVPALLEPGEFVMRRPAAKAIGGAALNQMNATGKNLTPPNIQVNLNNQGAPKNVQSAAPRVQGDKIIIDMITRDLRNNGPIKKSLRK